MTKDNKLDARLILSLAKPAPKLVIDLSKVLTPEKFNSN